MTYREVQYLADSEEILKFVSKYNLKLIVVNNQFIYLISHCYIIQIYGLVVENIFYFDFFSKDLSYSTTLNQILSDIDVQKLRKIHEYQEQNRKKVTIPKLQINQDQSNEAYTLKAEQYFFTKIQTMDELLSEIMSCKKEISKEHWSDTFEYTKNQLRIILKDIID